MEYLSQLLTLSGIVLLACISPGPDFVAVTSNALNDRRSGTFVGLGIACAVVVWATLAILGFGLLIKELFWLYETIRLVGAAYLIYLGARMLITSFRSRNRELRVGRASRVSGLQAWRQGFIVGITNPKTATFFATLFVTVLPVGAPTWVYVSMVALVGLITAGWLGILAAFFSVGRVRSVYMRVSRGVDALMGAALVGLGIRLASSR
ncbi:LysE family translocator [Allopusillimonas ginsengisoli]|uniref:LysE family translocator n=1 Tax=Allopusillimonas ginsengisoli TaxID=453575 RepID=UPI00102253BC|nr:LysE family transporter [Allopusillimonas ginsengisoli]TEA80159.1 lysine transporter LysE [Allopusillimonas ginsengisoli]